MKKLTILLVVLVSVLTSCKDVVIDDLMNDVVNHEWNYTGVSLMGVFHEGRIDGFSDQFLPNGMYIDRGFDDFDKPLKTTYKWVYKGDGVIRIDGKKFHLRLDNGVLYKSGMRGDDFIMMEHN